MALLIASGTSKPALFESSSKDRMSWKHLWPALVAVILLTIFEIAKFGPALAGGAAAAHFARGVDLSDKAQWGAAIAEYTQAIQLDNSLAEAYRNRGLVYAVMDETDKAMADAHHAAQLDPQDAKAYWLCGLIHSDRNEIAAAKADLEQAITLGLDPEKKLSAEQSLRQLQE